MPHVDWSLGAGPIWLLGFCTLVGMATAWLAAKERL